jgi:hypothetical protein
MQSREQRRQSMLISFRVSLLNKQKVATRVVFPTGLPPTPSTVIIRYWLVIAAPRDVSRHVQTRVAAIFADSCAAKRSIPAQSTKSLGGRIQQIYEIDLIAPCDGTIPNFLFARFARAGILMRDFHLPKKLAHQNRERIPERNVRVAPSWFSSALGLKNTCGREMQLALYPSGKLLKLLTSSPVFRAHQTETSADKFFSLVLCVARCSCSRLHRPCVADTTHTSRKHFPP